MPVDRRAFEETRARCEQTLLEARTTSGHWEGELSSSALSTATAVLALAAFDTGDGSDLVDRGIRWLTAHQNPDGGWGDTVISQSNISTTMLGWAAMAMAPRDTRDSTARAERWITRAAGSLEPRALARAIVRRYGDDRTFSVPILTVSALAGRLGEDDVGWRLVPQLPFELAALPQSWYQFLRLPVVSYALPALISMGQARHRKRPSRNPLLRAVRAGCRSRTLALLETIQPEGGGFLEATPLTSFVVASLVAAGQRDHSVTRRGVEFLMRSIRDDGSWPIDTNLATWLTTLSVGALRRRSWPDSDRERVRRWLLAQQYREPHPYTNAAPGGWAWTDLPGGVPDADDTAGALLALRRLGPVDGEAREAAALGVGWLVDLQNRDGGIPTFCRGWGKLAFDRSGDDLTAHALRAFAAWRDDLTPELRDRTATATRKALDFLRRRQRHEGPWAPLWFGNERAPNEENPLYGTTRVLLALGDGGDEAVMAMRRKASRWLVAAQNPDGGWGGDVGVTSSVEETALAVHALTDTGPTHLEAMARGVDWLLERTERGSKLEPAPIGLYFAKLWYFENLYPLIFTTAALNAADRLFDAQDA